MSLKVFLFLAPVALGGYYVASRETAPAGGAETAKAEGKAPAQRRTRDECNALERQLLEANAPADGNPVRAIGTLMGVERELRRQGCDTRNGYGAGNGFQRSTNRMGNPPPGAGESGQLHTSYDAPNGSPNQGTSFEPGRPMVDVNRDRARR